MMSVSFIVNLRAGHFKGRRVWQTLQKQLTIPYEVYETNAHGHATEITQQLVARKTNQLIIVVGGDGTVHEVVNGLQHASHVILGYVKAGSGNDYARSFPTFQNAAQIERFIESYTQMFVDCGKLMLSQQQNKAFINNCGIGFDAFICELVNESRVKKALNKIGLGKLSYAYFVALGLLKFKPFRLQVVTDDGVRSFQDVWFMTVSNQPYFGGGMKLSPQSVINDGKLEITVVSNISRFKFLTFFLTVFNGSHTRIKGVTQFQIEQAHLQVDSVQPFHMDGENDRLVQCALQCKVEQQAICVPK